MAISYFKKKKEKSEKKCKESAVEQLRLKYNNMKETGQQVEI